MRTVALAFFMALAFTGHVFAQDAAGPQEAVLPVGEPAGDAPPDAPTEETVGTLIENIEVRAPELEPEPEPESEAEPRPIFRPRLAASLGLGSMITAHDTGETRVGFGLSLSLLGGLQISDYAALAVEGTLFNGLDVNADQIYQLNALGVLELTLGALQLAGGLGVGFGSTLPTEAVNDFDAPRPPTGGPGRGVVYSGRVGLTGGSKTRFDRRGFVVSLRYDYLSAASPIHSIALNFGVQRF